VVGPFSTIRLAVRLILQITVLLFKTVLGKGWEILRHDGISFELARPLPTVLYCNLQTIRAAYISRDYHALRKHFATPPVTS
jgi:hypothetical protein